MLINTMVETYRVFDEFSIDVPNEIKNSIVELRQKFDEMMALVIICRIEFNVLNYDVVVYVSV